MVLTKEGFSLVFLCVAFTLCVPCGEKDLDLDLVFFFSQKNAFLCDLRGEKDLGLALAIHKRKVFSVFLRDLCGEKVQEPRYAAVFPTLRCWRCPRRARSGPKRGPPSTASRTSPSRFFPARAWLLSPSAPRCRLLSLIRRRCRR